MQIEKFEITHCDNEDIQILVFSYDSQVVT